MLHRTHRKGFLSKSYVRQKYISAALAAPVEHTAKPVGTMQSRVSFLFGPHVSEKKITCEKIFTISIFVAKNESSPGNIQIQINLNLIMKDSWRVSDPTGVVQGEAWQSHHIVFMLGLRGITGNYPRQSDRIPVANKKGNNSIL